MRILSLSAFLLLLVAHTLGAQAPVLLPEEDVPLSGAVEDLFNLGSLDGPEWAVFGAVLRLDFDIEGRLYVLDVHGAMVHAFAADGRHRWTAGGRGGGPGELSTPLRLAVAPDGSVLIGDLGRRAIVRLSGADGNEVGSRPYPEGLLVRDVVPVASGTVVLPSPNMIPEGPIPVLHLPDDGDPTEVAGASRSGVARVERTATGLRRVLPPTFSPGILLTGAAGSLYLADGADYAVRSIREDGRAVRIVRPLEPRPVREADRRAAREALRERLEAARSSSVGGFRTAAPSRDQIRERVAAMTFAEVMPAIRALRGAADGTLWVGRPGPVAPGPGPIDLLRGTEYVGTLPPMPFPDAVGPDGLSAWVETSGEGVPTIRVGRVALEP